MDDLQRLQELKIEIETLKAKLRRCLEDAFSFESIMDLNLEIDELIVQYHILKEEDK